jgi:hypothetical protein
VASIGAELLPQNLATRLNRVLGGHAWSEAHWERSRRMIGAQ